ncbi:Rieske (2Fe-2S) protein [Rhodoferax sp. GW822-FHT02A01]|uniref:Rieske (2Fe-2S) protein n=1 Tax=Rhodoferax sp. GW822-FHT02A01 TaxID=3141537 RepID=UPI00315DFFC4
MHLCHLDELPESGSRGCDPLRTGQDSILLVRKGGRVYAYADLCPHLDTPLAWRKNAYLNSAGDRIVCAAHGALFEIETGLCTLGPCLGQSLTSVPLTISPKGEILLARIQTKETRQ